jgi:ABC-type multidrug transport system fused ATPase/permease subunit
MNINQAKQTPTEGHPKPSKEGLAAREMLWSIVQPHVPVLTVATILNGLHGFAITFQVFTVGWLIDWVLGKGNIPPDMWRRAGALAAAYFLVSVLGRMLMWHLGYRLYLQVREKMLSSLRARLFRQLNALCLRFHMKRSSGELFSYLFGSPLQNIIQFYQHCATGLAGAFTTIISAVGVLVWTDWALTAVMSLTVSSQVIMMDRARRVSRKLHLDYQKHESAVTGTVADILRGSRAVKLHAMERTVEGEFSEQIRLISHKSYERDILTHLVWMKQETISYLGFGLMIVACAWRFSTGKVTLGEVSMFMLAFQQLSPPLTLISQAFTLWGGAQASLERIAEVLQETSTTPDPLENRKPVPPAGDLEFQNVTFAYEEKTILSDVNFRIPYGQSVALVGPSGSGKSTIAQLMLRLYDPNEGAIHFGGQDISQCEGSEVRKRFGVVPQDPFIFKTTIRKNLQVAKPDATDEEIEFACRQANAWEFISKLAEGIDTRVGEGGSNLSGGQRQRLAIARAILADPPVFLFDEATSALDTLSEQLIQDTLKRVCNGRTSIIIAHRLATVRDCQRILVVRNGRILQDGSYDTLIGTPGLFRELVEGQQLAVS